MSKGCLYRKSDLEFKPLIEPNRLKAKVFWLSIKPDSFCYKYIPDGTCSKDNEHRGKKKDILYNFQWVSLFSKYTKVHLSTHEPLAHTNYSKRLIVNAYNFSNDPQE